MDSTSIKLDNSLVYNNTANNELNFLTSEEDKYCDEFFYSKNVEEDFCRNFSCCGLVLGDLHDLLQHYEECHVKFEEETQLGSPTETVNYSSDWNGTKTAYNFCADLPISFTLSNPADMLNLGQSLISDVSPSDIDIQNQMFSSSDDGGSMGILSPDDFSSDSDLTRTNSTVDFSKLDEIYKQFGSDYAASLLNNNSKVNKKRKLDEGLSILDGFNSGASTSVENSPPLSPNLNSALSIDTLANSEFDFSHLFEKSGNLQINFDNNQLNHKKNMGCGRDAELSNSIKLSPQSNLELTFGSSALSLYDDDIISALSNSTDPLFLVKNAVSPNKSKQNKKQRLSTNDVRRSLSTSKSTSNLMKTSLPPKTKKTSQSGVNLPASLSAAMADAVSNEAARLGQVPSPCDDKPHRCLLAGCNKAYKNPNGLKYHTIHGHCDVDHSSVSKPYKCLVPNCSRAYKNLNGLKYHILHTHSSGENDLQQKKSGEKEPICTV